MGKADPMFKSSPAINEGLGNMSMMRECGAFLPEHYKDVEAALADPHPLVGDSYNEEIAALREKYASLQRTELADLPFVRTEDVVQDRLVAAATLRRDARMKIGARWGHVRETLV